MRFYCSALASVFLLTVVGCGGGGSNTPIPAGVSMQVNWPARSRTVDAPTSALSVVVTIHATSGHGQDVRIAADRNDNASAHIETYTGQLPSNGNYTYTVNFYAGKAGAGAIVASGGGSATVTGAFTLPAVSLEGKITSVAIPAGQMVHRGDTTELAVEAKDAQNNLIALSPGSFTWSFEAGADHLSNTPTGFRGESLGSSTLKVSVDGIASASTNVSVFENVFFRGLGSSSEVTYQDGNGAWKTMPYDTTAGAFHGMITDPAGRYACGPKFRTYHVTVAETTTIEMPPPNPTATNGGQISGLLLNVNHGYVLSTFSAQSAGAHVIQAGSIGKNYSQPAVNGNVIALLSSKTDVPLRAMVKHGFMDGQNHTGVDYDFFGPGTYAYSQVPGYGVASAVLNNFQIRLPVTNGNGYVLPIMALEPGDYQEMMYQPTYSDRTRHTLLKFRDPNELALLTIPFAQPIQNASGTFDTPSATESSVRLQFNQVTDATMYSIEFRSNDLGSGNTRTEYCLVSPGYLASGGPSIFDTSRPVTWAVPSGCDIEIAALRVPGGLNQALKLTWPNNTPRDLGGSLPGLDSHVQMTVTSAFLHLTE